MKENKPIIVDGIDVSLCPHHFTSSKGVEMCDKCRCFEECKPRERQCYFYITSIEKQLQSTQQQYNAVIEQNRQLQEAIKAKEQECEELKAYIKSKEGLGDDCDFCKYNNKSECYANANIDFFKENTRYKQALEKIEEILKHYAYTSLGIKESDGTYSFETPQTPIILKYDPRKAQEGLDIINEVKDE